MAEEFANPDEAALNEDEELYTVLATKKSKKSPSPRSAARGFTEDEGDIPYHRIEFIQDVPLRLSVEIGQTRLSVREILALHQNKVVEFNKVVGEPMDITISGRLMARGEVVVVNERYGVRISEVTRPDESGPITSQNT
ncbi:MAG: flagellar motor switch protein FliN [Deltaproteobacteria bacterium]|nr:flagellar motor switch protein FliN [Deltaproteobacteria bacterium]